MSTNRYKYIWEYRGTLSEERVLLRHKLTDESRAVPSEVNRFARLCNDFRSIEEHSEYLHCSAHSAISKQRCQELVRDAVSLGLLISLHEYQERFASHLFYRRPAVIVSQIAVPTKNRPVALARLLEQLQVHLRQHGRTADVCVVDDSEQPSINLANAEVIRKAGSSCMSLRYENRSSRSAFAKELASISGLPLELVSFAVLGHAGLPTGTGSARNTALLRTSGRAVLFLDDDVECSLLLHPDAAQASVFGAEKTLIRFFRNSEELRQLPATGESLLGIHEQALAPRAGLEECDLDATHIPTALLRRVSEGGIVLAGTLGIAGDSGYDDPMSYYLQDEDTWRRLTESEAVYRAALRNRLILRAPAEICVSDSSGCQSHCLSLRNDLLLPPFLPSLRGQDLVFGALLHKCFPGSLVGMIPRAITHTPLQERSYEPDSALHRIGRITAGEAIAFLAASSVLRGDREDERLSWLGDTLIHLSRLRPCELSKAIYQAAEPMLYAWYQQLQTKVRNYSLGERFGSDDAARLRDKVERVLVEGSICIASDLIPGFGTQDSFLLFQQMLGRFGELLPHWALLWRAAQQFSNEPALHA